MKKLSKLFMLSFLGLSLSLVGCANTNPTLENDDIKGNEVTEQEKVVSFLVLGEGGLYKGEAGTTVPNLYLEHAVRFEATPGTKLPTAQDVSHKNGLYFHKWVRVDGHGHETKVKEVPQSDYNVYYAIFGEEEAGIEMNVYFKAPKSWTKAYIYAWSKKEMSMDPWPGTPMTKDEDLGLFVYEYDTKLYSNVIFNNGSGVQSPDLLSPTDPNKDCYVWKNGWYNEDTTEVPLVPEEGEVKRVYLNAPQTWLTPNIYAWTLDEIALVAWPGTPMTKDTELGLWYYDYDTTYYANVLFNYNGDANKTPDLTSPIGDNDTYHVEYGIWYNHEEGTPDEPTINYGPLYFAPALWDADNAWFAVWCWGAGDQWVTLTEVSDTHYTFTLPTGTTGFLFVRLNPAAQTPSWVDNVWNQTGDLTLPKGSENCYTMTTYESGVWSTYTA